MYDRAEGAELRHACREALQTVGVGDVEGERFDRGLMIVVRETRRGVDHGLLVAVDEHEGIDHVDEPGCARRAHPAPGAGHDSHGRHGLPLLVPACGRTRSIPAS